MGKKDMSASNKQPAMLLETNTTEVPAFHSEDFFRLELYKYPFLK